MSKKTKSFSTLSLILIIFAVILIAVVIFGFATKWNFFSKDNYEPFNQEILKKMLKKIEDGKKLLIAQISEANCKKSGNPELCKKNWKTCANRCVDIQVPDLLTLQSLRGQPLKQMKYIKDNMLPDGKGGGRQFKPGDCQDTQDISSLEKTDNCGTRLKENAINCQGMIIDHLIHKSSEKSLESQKTCKQKRDEIKGYIQNIKQYYLSYWNQQIADARKAQKKLESCYEYSEHCTEAKKNVQQYLNDCNSFKKFWEDTIEEHKDHLKDIQIEYETGIVTR